MQSKNNLGSMLPHISTISGQPTGQCLLSVVLSGVASVICDRSAPTPPTLTPLTPTPTPPTPPTATPTPALHHPSPTVTPAVAEYSSPECVQCPI